MALTKGASVRIMGLRAIVERLALAGGMPIVARIRETMVHGAEIIAKEIEAEGRRRSSGKSHWFTWKRHGVHVLVPAYSLALATRSAVSKVQDKPGAWAATTLKLAPQAYMVEFGTRGKPGHPFFRAAVERAKGPARAQIITELNDLMDEQFGSGWSHPTE